MYVYRINYFECVSQVILSKSNYFNDFTNQIKEDKAVKSIEFIGQINEEQAANQFGIRYSKPIEGNKWDWKCFYRSNTVSNYEFKFELKDKHNPLIGELFVNEIQLNHFEIYRIISKANYVDLPLTIHIEYDIIASLKI